MRTEIPQSSNQNKDFIPAIRADTERLPEVIALSLTAIFKIKNKAE